MKFLNIERFATVRDLRCDKGLGRVTVFEAADAAEGYRDDAPACVLRALAVLHRPLVPKAWSSIAIRRHADESGTAGHWFAGDGEVRMTGMFHTQGRRSVIARWEGVTGSGAPLVRVRVVGNRGEERQEVIAVDPDATMPVSAKEWLILCWWRAPSMPSMHVVQGALEVLSPSERERLAVVMRRIDPAIREVHAPVDGYNEKLPAVRVSTNHGTRRLHQMDPLFSAILLRVSSLYANAGTTLLWPYYDQQFGMMPPELHEDFAAIAQDRKCTLVVSCVQGGEVFQRAFERGGADTRLYALGERARKPDTDEVMGHTASSGRAALANAAAEECEREAWRYRKE